MQRSGATCARPPCGEAAACGLELWTRKVPFSLSSRPGPPDSGGEETGRRQEVPTPGLRAKTWGPKLKRQRFRPHSRRQMTGVCILTRAALRTFKTGHTWPQVRPKHHLPRQLIYFHPPPPAVLSSSSSLSPPCVHPATALRDSRDWQVPIYRPPTSLLCAGPRRGLEPPPCMSRNQINTEVLSKQQVCAQRFMQNRLNSIRSASLYPFKKKKKTLLRYKEVNKLPKATQLARGKNRI